MRKRVIEIMKVQSSKFAVLIDAATKSVLNVHIKTDFGNNQPIFIFLELIEFENQSAEAITTAIITAFKSAGLNEEYFLDNWV